MKRLTPAEAAEWRRRSAEKVRARLATRHAGRAKKPPTPKALRKRAEDAEHRVNRQQRFVQARGQCEFMVNRDMVSSRCARPATDGHHLKQRSTQVDHSTENLRVLCHSHHMHVHAYPAWAEANGWLIRDYPQIQSKED